MSNRCRGSNGNTKQLTSSEYSELAREGIQLMLNNKFTEAEELFKSHTEDSLHMAAGYCYLTFMVNIIQNIYDIFLKYNSFCRVILCIFYYNYINLSP